MKYIFLAFISLSAWADSNLIEQGRHLVKVASCNDCHTPMYPEKNGEIPEKDWLTGSPVGFKGPWGVSYASNLRLYVKSFNEKNFIGHIRSRKFLPPMPSPAMQAMTDDELRALYAFLKHLGDGGAKTPVNLAPGAKSKGQVIHFYPVADK